MYHYAANNPVKYTDPDGRSDCYFFDFSNYFNNSIYSLGYAFEIGKRNIKGHLRNFFANLKSGNYDLYLYGELSLQIGALSYGGKAELMLNGKLRITPKCSDDAFKIAKNIQESLNFPIVFSSNEIEIGAKMLTVSLGHNEKGEMTVDVNIDLLKIITKKNLPVKATAGLKIYVPTADGPYPTISNPDFEMNNLVNQYNNATDIMNYFY